MVDSCVGLNKVLSRCAAIVQRPVQATHDAFGYCIPVVTQRRADCYYRLARLKFAAVTELGDRGQLCAHFDNRDI